jgi:DNA-binding CsgD family transcriptional regulator
LVGLAVLSLLAVVGEEEPLLCLVDDVQWLDRASIQALGLAARRLLAERVGLIFAVRTPIDELANLPTLEVRGLADADARLVLASVIRGRIDEQVHARLVAEARGNPLALLELPRGMTGAELAGGFGLAVAGPLSGRIEASFLRQLAPLPAASRRLLLIAATEPVGDPRLVWRAAGQLEVEADAAEPAVASGLVDFGNRVRFRHPLVRSAVYGASSIRDRQQVHHALAEATDPEVDPDRRAWHRAHATTRPDEAVADELERSADRAQARGGLAAAAAFLERAALLTPEPARRAARALAAANAMYQAGAFDAALSLVAIAEAEPIDELQRARAELVRAQIVYVSNRGRDVPALLLASAGRLEPLDIRLARETYLEAVTAAMFAARLGSGTPLVEVAHAALAAPPAPQGPDGVDLLLDGLATRFTDGYAAAAPTLKRALTAFRREDLSVEDGVRWLSLACWVAADLWDDQTWEVLSRRNVQLVRDAGALTVLPTALCSQGMVHLLAGELMPAASLIEEMKAVGEATGTHIAPYAAVCWAVVQGRADQAAALIEATVEDGTARGEGFSLSATEWASAVLYNGLTRHKEALVAARQCSENPTDLAASTWALSELVEAAARSGVPTLAAATLRQLEVLTHAADTEWARGVEAVSRALVSNGDIAEALYHEAIERLAATRVVVALGRAHLLYGEWLGGENRRDDARVQLRLAYEMFNRIGAEAFADRSGRELRATGELVRDRTGRTLDKLSAQEAEIARMARDGFTNSQIGARLFISARTVEWHLTSVFTKLQITSRRGLRQVLPDLAGASPLV